MNALHADIHTIKPLTNTIMQVILIVNSQPRFHYQAGQYIQIINHAGDAIPFSIANADLGSSQLELHIRHTPDNPIASTLLKEFQSDDKVNFTGPHGHSTITKRQANRPTIFIAGGTGFAPIKAMIEQVLADGDDTALHLYWGARTLEDLYADELPKQWLAHVPFFQYTPVLSQSSPSDWSGKTGLITDTLLADYPDLSAHQLYIAGPQDMVLALKQACLNAGADKKNIYSDY